MKHFIHNAFQELHHVVWPTQAETKKYFTIVTSVIAVCALVFFVFGTAITSALFAIRDVVVPPESRVIKQETSTEANNLLKKLQQKVQSGATSSGTTSSGVSSTAQSGATTSNTSR